MIVIYIPRFDIIIIQIQRKYKNIFSKINSRKTFKRSKDCKKKIVFVLVTIALAIEIHPYFLLVSATLAASCAFMLPISTPPNAVVFSSGFLKIEDMFKKGIWMNIISIITITFVVYYTLPYVFEMTAMLYPVN